MAVIDPELPAVHLIVGVKSKVRTFIKIYDALPYCRKTAEGDITGPSSILMVDEIFCLVALEPLAEQCLDCIDVFDMEFLQAYDVGLLRKQVGNDRVCTFL